MEYYIISEDDFTIEDCTRGGYQLGSGDYGYIGNFDSVKLSIEAFKNWCAKNQYWPTLWYISDHGNYWPIDTDGNEIKEARL